MIKGNRKIAFVYGQSSYPTAIKAKNHIEEKYIDYPLEVVICDDVSFQETKIVPEIMNVIKEEFRDVEFAIIFIGQDDYFYHFSREDFESLTDSTELIRLFVKKLFDNNTMSTLEQTEEKSSEIMKFSLSQNAIFELGYLWNKILPENIRFISVLKNNSNSNYKLPSDIPQEYLYPCDKMFECLDAFILKVMEVKSHRDLLLKDNYSVEYCNLFSAPELTEYSSLNWDTNILKYFNSIYKKWSSQCEKLKSDDAKLLFMFERLIFVPYFPTNAGCPFDILIKKIQEKVNNKENKSYEILCQIGEYIRICSEKSNILEDYQKIADALIRVNKEIEKKYEPINPIVKIYLNNYIGLSCRKTFEKSNGGTKYIECYLNSSIEALKKCEVLVGGLTNKTAILWRGFSTFNIARSYQQLESEYNQSMEKMQSAYNIRQRWINDDCLKDFPLIFNISFFAEIIFAADEARKMNCFINDVEKKEVIVACKKISNWIMIPGFDTIQIIEAVKKCELFKECLKTS